MKHCNTQCSAGASGGHWLGDASSRYPDFRDRARRGLKAALEGLLAPAERLHNLRSMRSAMFYDAVDRLDRSHDCE